jgi:lipoprotein-releasing system ATP-binding protein
MSEGTGMVLEGRDIRKSYGQGDTTLEILRGATIGVRRGEVVSVSGPSGSGKSTLLHILGVLDRPDGGRVLIGGRDAWEGSERSRARIRNRSLGFVFQFHHLMEEFTIAENVAMPLLLAGENRRTAMIRAGKLLQQVEMDHRAGHFPSEVSGGERQRTAVARALVREPDVVLADEPTGNLDAVASGRVEKMILELAETRGQAFILATHSRELASRAHRRTFLRGGAVVEEG